MRIRDKDLSYIGGNRFHGEIFMEGLAPKRTSEARVFLKLILKWQASVKFQKAILNIFVPILDCLKRYLHHRAPNLANKHALLTNVIYLKKFFQLPQSFSKILPIQRQSVNLFAHSWSALSANSGILNRILGTFKQNKFIFETFLWKYTKCQIFLSLTVPFSRK